MHQESMSIIRSGLKARIDALASSQGNIAGLREQIDLIRQDAHRHGLMPAAHLAAAMAEMLAAGTMGRAVASSLDLMRDAVECDDNRPEIGMIYMAALTSRFGH